LNLAPPVGTIQKLLEQQINRRKKKHTSLKSLLGILLRYSLLDMIRGVSTGICCITGSLGIPNKVFNFLVSRSKVYLTRHDTQVRLLFSRGQFKRSAVVDRFPTKSLVDHQQRYFRNFERNQSSLSKMSRYFSQGEGTMQVPMDLFAVNRDRLCKSLRQLPKLQKNSVVVLQGGQGIPRYCTDVEYVFRQVYNYCLISIL
jgi:hypothetical protein